MTTKDRQIKKFLVEKIRQREIEMEADKKRLDEINRCTLSPCRIGHDMEQHK